MAVGKEKEKNSSFFRKKFNFFKRLFLTVILILSGGVIFNLDRLDNLGIQLLKYKNFLPAPIIKFLPGGLSEPGSAVPEQEIDGRIIEVYDGDTATLLTQNNKKYKVRFYGIDAPEAAQNFGMVSRDNLRKKILGQDVTLKVVSQDRYGRVVCKVMFRGRYINREMVSEGMAWYYADYAKNEYELSLAQEEARSSAAGLWKNSDPQPPWEWRKAKKKKK